MDSDLQVIPQLHSWILFLASHTGVLTLFLGLFLTLEYKFPTYFLSCRFHQVLPQNSVSMYLAPFILPRNLCRWQTSPRHHATSTMPHSRDGVFIVIVAKKFYSDFLHLTTKASASLLSGVFVQTSYTTPGGPFWELAFFFPPYRPDVCNIFWYWCDAHVYLCWM